MMTAYSITRGEAWALATLLSLPVQPTSLLSYFLNDGSPPAGADQMAVAFNALARRDLYHGDDKANPLPVELVQALTLASVNPADLTLLIQSQGSTAITQFAIAGPRLVQYGMNENWLFIHTPVLTVGSAETLLPGWFNPVQYEHDENNHGQQIMLPLPAFLLFRQACALAVRAAVDSDLDNETFSKDDLIKETKISADWVDIFAAEGIRSVVPVKAMHLEEYFQQLTDCRLIKATDLKACEIGEGGRALAITIQDPDLCTLSVTMQTAIGGHPQVGAYLFGAGRLFLLETNPVMVSIRPLGTWAEGAAWLESVLQQGSRVHWPDFVFAPLPSTD
jgi:hypothetical protein